MNENAVHDRVDTDLLPNSKRFAFWEDSTVYRRDYHVAANDSRASDDNTGSADHPLATISRAAAIVAPGERVIVHEGIYRECVCPARGGSAPDRMIAYQAAPGEGVTLRGSERWRPDAQLSRGWRLPPRDLGYSLWMADLPHERFGSYNPFLVRNAYDYLPRYGNRNDPRWLQRALLRRGAVYEDGVALKQVARFAELLEHDGAFWVEEPGRRVHFRLRADRQPDGISLEVSAREQIFAPDTVGLGYIRVSGFHLEHAAGPLPVPQRGALSACRGHHWIIENNIIRHANGCGVDIGMQSWDSDLEDTCGHHVIRGNTISDCGVCGIAGARGVKHTLIEDNRLERIGGLDLELMAECAGIKFHFCEDTLIRNNYFAHFAFAGGVWLDVDNKNCRITSNVFTDIASFTGAVYSEMNPDRNLVDHNIFWDIRINERPDVPHAHINDLPYGPAVRADCNENLVVAHNFFGRIEGYAIAFTLHQSDRPSQGRTGLCRANVAVNNVFFACTYRIHLGRREENITDSNLYDVRGDALSFHIAWPDPGCRQNMHGWQHYFGQELHGTQGLIEAEFDPGSANLTWRLVEGEMPKCSLMINGVTTQHAGPARACL